MDYVWNRTRETISKKPTYMNNMTRRECTNIFAVRSRMLKVKGNYKNKYTDKYADGARTIWKHKSIY